MSWVDEWPLNPLIWNLKEPRCCWAFRFPPKMLRHYSESREIPGPEKALQQALWGLILNNTNSWWKKKIRIHNIAPYASPDSFPSEKISILQVYNTLTAAEVKFMNRSVSPLLIHQPPQSGLCLGPRAAQRIPACSCRDFNYQKRQSLPLGSPRLLSQPPSFSTCSPPSIPLFPPWPLTSHTLKAL